MVSSSKEVSSALFSSLGSLVGSDVGRFTNFGVDNAAGGALRAPGRGRAAKLKSRIAASLRKTRRLGRHADVLGQKCVRLFAS
eukprot:279499-Pyramimonas_sp.AAC.1